MDANTFVFISLGATLITLGMMVIVLMLIDGAETPAPGPGRPDHSGDTTSHLPPVPPQA